MLDNHLLHSFFILLRSGLWERDVEDVSLFPLNEEEWNFLFDLSRQQRVTAVVFQGVNHLPNDLMPGFKSMARWMAEVDAVERRNHRMNAALAELYSGIKLKGYTALVLKGQGVAQNYAFPMTRDCGDIDLFFRAPIENIAFANMVKTKGVEVSMESDGSRCYTWKGVVVEQHPQMLDLQTPNVKRFFESLQKEEKPVDCRIDNHLTIKIPAPILNLVLQNSHILKHALGRGVGLRQLCDLARTYAVLRGKIDGERVYEVYRRAGLLKWSELLHAFLVKDLGLNPADLPYGYKEEVSSEPLREIVLKGGNFGLYTDGELQSAPNGWKRKWKTFSLFLKNMGFALKYAPCEAFWTIVNLAKGAIKAG